ncbi:MAG: type II toxin-antitoxin system VapC family toxin [Anaerolineae bacterium]
MSHYYCDSSALVKLYVQENGTDWMRRLSQDADNVLYTARISAAEIVAALSMRRRTGSIAADDAVSAVSAFRRDLTGRLHMVEITDGLVELAMALAEKHPLRGYDAIQLAAALELQRVRQALSLSPVAFVCADGRLNAITHAEGLAVVDPANVTTEG